MVPFQIFQQRYKGRALSLSHPSRDVVVSKNVNTDTTENISVPSVLVGREKLR